MIHLENAAEGNCGMQLSYKKNPMDRRQKNKRAKKEKEGEKDKQIKKGVKNKTKGGGN